MLWTTAIFPARSTPRASTRSKSASVGVTQVDRLAAASPVAVYWSGWHLEHSSPPEPRRLPVPGS